MKQITASIMSILIMLLLSVQGISQNKKMTWTTKSKAADALASSGVNHLINVELPQAYSDFTAALKLDPNFTPVLVLMSNLTQGETQKVYAQRALKSASNKTEGEKLFASLVQEKNTREDRSNIFTKLHSMFPDGEMLAAFYVRTRATPEERFAAAQEFIKKFPNNAAMYNTIAYYYMQDKKDNEMAKKNLEKYLAMYPEGTNPYDSMGEYYLNTGDTANASKYYTMALEKYPFNHTSLNALQKIADDKKKGDMK